MVAVTSPFTGRVVSLDEVDDEVFSERVMGEGVAVQPSSGEVVAPLSGRIEMAWPLKTRTACRSWFTLGSKL
jgi:phosphotransferase system IIA component